MWGRYSCTFVVSLWENTKLLKVYNFSALLLTTPALLLVYLHSGTCLAASVFLFHSVSKQGGKKGAKKLKPMENWLFRKMQQTEIKNSHWHCVLQKNVLYCVHRQTNRHHRGNWWPNSSKTETEKYPKYIYVLTCHQIGLPIGMKF